MNLGKANAIFRQLEDDRFTEEEKLEAIMLVLDMPTHNGITKDAILDAFRWFFDYCIEEVEQS